MKNYKNYLTLLCISIICITSGCKTKKIQNTPVNNQPIVLVNDTIDGVVSTSEVRMAVFPGGEEAMLAYISKSLRYPVESAKKGTQGRVICSFVILENGRTAEIESTTEMDPLLKKEAFRVIKSMPKWIPGEKNGKKIRVRYTLPIVFRLN